MPRRHDVVDLDGPEQTGRENLFIQASRIAECTYSVTSEPREPVVLADGNTMQSVQVTYPGGHFPDSDRVSESHTRTTSPAGTLVSEHHTLIIVSTATDEHDGATRSVIEISFNLSPALAPAVEVRRTATDVASGNRKEQWYRVTATRRSGYSEAADDMNQEEAWQIIESAGLVVGAPQRLALPEI
jgi:hypothetical protein